MFSTVFLLLQISLNKLPDITNKTLVHAVDYLVHVVDYLVHVVDYLVHVVDYLVHAVN